VGANSVGINDMCIKDVGMLYMCNLVRLTNQLNQSCAQLWCTCECTLTSWPVPCHPDLSLWYQQAGRI
jgi:hypothetical protein